MIDAQISLAKYVDVSIIVGFYQRRQGTGNAD
jgi:hypothetical protein